MDNFEAESQPLFRQRELFNILMYERRLIHRELSNKGTLMREFETVDIVVLRKISKSSRKEKVDPKIVLKTKGPYSVLEKATPSSYWLQRLPFCEVLGRP